MPNAIIAMGRATIIGNVHLHCRHHREVEGKVAIKGITENYAGDEKDVVGDSRVPKEYQHMLL